MSKPIGSQWRIKYDEAPTKRGGMYGPTHHVVSADYPAADPKGQQGKRTVFDELVIRFPRGSIHLEQMSSRIWFLGVGDEKIMITVGKDGVPRMGERYR